MRVFATHAIPWLLSAALILGLAFLLDWRLFLGLFRVDRMEWYAAAGAFYLLTLAARAARLMLLFAPLSRRPFPPGAAMDLAVVGTFANHVMPLRTGELAFVLLPRLTGAVGTDRALLALLTARVYDALALLLITAGAVALAMPGEGLWPVILWAALLGIAMAAFRLDFGLRLLRTALGAAGCRSRGRVAGWLARLGRFASRLHEGSLLLRGPRSAAGLLAASLVAWAALLCFFGSLLAAFGMALPAASVVLGSVGASLAQLMPVGAIGSFGTFEAGWTGGFTAMGLSLEQAVASGLAAHLVAVALSGLLAGVSIIRMAPSLRHGLKELRSHARAS